MSYEITSQPRCRVLVKVTGTPDVKADYIDRMIEPYHAEVTFHYLASGWAAVRVVVSGSRVLKPGPGGVRRVSDELSHKAEWSGFLGHDVRDRGARKPLPEWLSNLVTAAQPAGDVKVQGKLW